MLIFENFEMNWSIKLYMVLIQVLLYSQENCDSNHYLSGNVLENKSVNFPQYKTTIVMVCSF